MTIYGYTLEHLIFVAEMLKKENITINDIANSQTAYRQGYEDSYENMMKSIKVFGK
jgi:hypothetical protein